MINLGASPINMGTNVLDKKQESPTTSLDMRGQEQALPAGVPNEPMSISSVVPQAPQDPVEAPQGAPIESSVAADTLAPVSQEQLPMEDMGVPTDTPQETMNDIPNVAGEGEEIPAATADSFLSISRKPIKDVRLSTEKNIAEFLSNSKAPITIAPKEKQEWEMSKKAFLDGLTTVNKLAYGVVKGAANTLDFITTPGWVIGSLLADGQRFPFKSLLDSHYPEKNYQFDEDPDSYMDETLRLSQVGLEFTSTGALTNVAAKVATKGAYLPTMAQDLSISFLSSIGYQGSKEMGATDEVALLVSLVAPMSPQAFKEAITYGVVKPTIVTAKGSLWALDKAISISPLLGPLRSVIKEVASPSSSVFVQTKKYQLIQDPAMWSDTFLKRKARDMVLKVPDYERSMEQQAEEIADITHWVRNAIPDTPELRARRDSMQALQDTINKTLPEGSEQLSFTLDQVYQPVLKDMGATDGLDVLLDSARLTNNDYYNKQIVTNQKLLYGFLKNLDRDLGPEETKIFHDVFNMQVKALDNLTDDIFDAAYRQDVMEDIGNALYLEPSEAVKQGVRKSLDGIKQVYDGAYEGMLDALPKNIELDTTPVNDSLVEVFNKLGVFSDPKSVPAYIRNVVRQISVPTEGDSTYTGLLNKSGEATKAVNEGTRKIRELSIQHADEIATFKSAAPDDKEGLLLLTTKQAKETEVLRIAQKDLKGLQIDLDKQKREARGGSVTDVTDGLPEINIHTVGDVRQGLRAVNDALKVAFGKQDDSYENLLILKGGLEDAMKGLDEVDPVAYKMFNDVNTGYSSFVGHAFHKSHAGDIMSVQGFDKLEQQPIYKLSTVDAFEKIWVNSDSDKIEYLMKNFDSSRKGLDAFLEPAGAGAKEGYNLLSDDGIRAMKDMVYSALAREVRELDTQVIIDPAERMAKISQVLAAFSNKHGAKLDKVPGLSNLSEDVPATLDRMSDYIVQLKKIEDRKALTILNKVVGPSASISNILKDSAAAEQMVMFLENRLPKIDYDGQGSLVVGEASATAVRKTLRSALLNKYTSGDRLNHKELGDILAVNTDSRNNLSRVLGEPEVIKVEAVVAMSKALSVGDTKFTDIIMKDTTLKALEKLGLPLGRISSMLQRRAVFAPSGAWVAGAAATKVLNHLGRQQTAKALRLLIEQPLEALNLDQILIKEMAKLNERQKAQVAEVMAQPNRSMRELLSFLPDKLAPHIRGHLATLGIKMSEQDAKDILKETLLEDPRHPEMNQKEKEVKPTGDISDTQLQEIIRNMSTEERAALMTTYKGD